MEKPSSFRNVMLNEKMVELLKPLLLSQPDFKTCDIWKIKE